MILPQTSRCSPQGPSSAPTLYLIRALVTFILTHCSLCTLLHRIHSSSSLCRMVRVGLFVPMARACKMCPHSFSALEQRESFEAHDAQPKDNVKPSSRARVMIFMSTPVSLGRLLLLRTPSAHLAVHFRRQPRQWELHQPSPLSGCPRLDVHAQLTTIQAALLTAQIRT